MREGLRAGRDRQRTTHPPIGRAARSTCWGAVIEAASGDAADEHMTPAACRQRAGANVDDLLEWKRAPHEGRVRDELRCSFLGNQGFALPGTRLREGQLTWSEGTGTRAARMARPPYEIEFYEDQDGDLPVLRWLREGLHAAETSSAWRGDE